MSSKLKRPLIYLVAVLGIAAAFFYFDNPWKPKAGDRLNRPLLGELETAEVARIEIEHLLEGVQLRKTETGWEVAPMTSTLQKNLVKSEKTFPEVKNDASKIETAWETADADKIAMRLDLLQGTTVLAQAGQNPELHGRYHVNAGGLHLRLFDADGPKQIHLIAGKPGPDFTDGFLRFDGDDAVYLVSRHLPTSWPVTLEGWKPVPDEAEKNKD